MEAILTVLDSFNIQSKIGIRSSESVSDFDEPGEGAIALTDSLPSPSPRPPNLLALPDYAPCVKACFTVAVRSSISLDIKPPHTTISIAMRLNLESISISLDVDVDRPATPQRNLGLSAADAREVQEASQKPPRPARERESERARERKTRERESERARDRNANLRDLMET
jgi:hypothetical protein